MNELIITTGPDGILISKWFPSLRNIGKYSGDVLLLNYDMTSDGIKNVQRFGPILVQDVKRVYDNIATDRIRAIKEFIGEIVSKYDVIMLIDASDIEFFKPIQPLLDMAKDKLCYVAQAGNNSQWIPIDTVPDAARLWEIIKDQRLINGGVWLAPSKIFCQVIEYIAQGLTYRSQFGYDQLLLNALVYTNMVPSIRANKMWDYDGRRGYRLATENKIDKAYGMDDCEIAILHRI